MRQLPLLTIVFLVVGILAWNFSFYGDFYRARSARRTVRAETRAPQLHTVAPGAIGADADSPRAIGKGFELDDRVLANPASTAAPSIPEGTVPVPSEPGAQWVEHRYPSGALKSVGDLVAGRRHGEWTEYWDEGAVLMTGRYEDGARVGEWTFNHDDGSLRSRGQYVAGLRDGYWESFHSNGRKLSEGRHSEEDGGERVGLWTRYFTGGDVMERGTYVRGVMEGDWEFYDSPRRSSPRSGFYERGVLQRD